MPAEDSRLGRSRAPTLASSRRRCEIVDLFGMDTNLWTAGAAVAQTIIIAAAAAFAFRQVREVQLTARTRAGRS